MSIDAGADYFKVLDGYLFMFHDKSQGLALTFVESVLFYEYLASSQKLKLFAQLLNVGHVYGFIPLSKLYCRLFS